MECIDEKDLNRIGLNWTEKIDFINEALRNRDENDYAQPVKPNLHYRNPCNRIIAMPAFVDGEYNKAGIKWIANFPGNIKNSIPRAHSIVNNADTGVPGCIGMQ